MFPAISLGISNYILPYVWLSHLFLPNPTRRDESIASIASIASATASLATALPRDRPKA